MAGMNYAIQIRTFFYLKPIQPIICALKSINLFIYASFWSSSLICTENITLRPKFADHYIGKYNHACHEQSELQQHQRGVAIIICYIVNLIIDECQNQKHVKSTRRGMVRKPHIGQRANDNLQMKKWSAFILEKIGMMSVNRRQYCKMLGVYLTSKKR